MKVLLLIAALLMPAFTSFSQAPLSSMLAKDSSHRYFFMRQISTGKSKAYAYSKAKEWAKTNLDPADNYFLADDTGNDSLRTEAFMALDDLPQAQNQVISYQLLLQFNEGTINIYANAFIYHGDNKSNGDSYDLPLGNMKSIDASTQPAVIYAFDKKFARQISNLEHAVR